VICSGAERTPDQLKRVGEPENKRKRNERVDQGGTQDEAGKGTTLSWRETPTLEGGRRKDSKNKVLNIMHARFLA